MWRTINVESGEPIRWTERDFPIAIHGTPKQGSSFYTIVLTAEFVRLGERVLLMSAKGEAVRALQAELGEHRPASKFNAITAPAATALSDMQLVTMVNKRDLDIGVSLRALHDWGERILVVKNCDEIVTPVLWEIIRSHPRLILSGDFSRFPVSLQPDSFATCVAFSQLPERWGRTREKLPPYVGEGVRRGKRFQTIVQSVSDAQG